MLIGCTGCRWPEVHSHINFHWLDVPAASRFNVPRIVKYSLAIHHTPYFVTQVHYGENLRYILNEHACLRLILPWDNHILMGKNQTLIFKTKQLGNLQSSAFV